MKKISLMTTTAILTTIVLTTGCSDQDNHKMVSKRMTILRSNHYTVVRFIHHYNQKINESNSSLKKTSLKKRIENLKYGYYKLVEETEDYGEDIPDCLYQLEVECK